MPTWYIAIKTSSPFSYQWTASWDVYIFEGDSDEVREMTIKLSDEHNGNSLGDRMGYDDPTAKEINDYLTLDCDEGFNDGYALWSYVQKEYCMEGFPDMIYIP
jgi:hypothetical protein